MSLPVSKYKIMIATSRSKQACLTYVCLTKYLTYQTKINQKLLEKFQITVAVTFRKGNELLNQLQLNELASE